MKLRINANAVITNSEGKVLLVRLKKGPFKGGLCIPGGGIDPGEMSHETARREIAEETGITTIQELEPFGFCEMKHTDLARHRVVLLLAGKAEGTPEETEEGVAGWHDIDAVKEEMIPFTKEAIRIWKNNDVHFKLLEDDTGIRDYGS